MEAKPFQEIKISDITKKADVSRMAYYRNYQEKSEILTQHLEAFLRSYQDRLNDMRQLTEKELWLDFFSALKGDPILKYIRMAGLMAPTIDIFTGFTTDIYSRIFQWDMKDLRNQMVIYQRMGLLAGLMMFLIDHHQEADVELLAEQVISIAGNDRDREPLSF